MKQLLRIIPPESKGHAVKTQGTRVLTADGSEVHGVTSITLHAEPNSAWEATIRCYVQPPEMSVPTHVELHARLTWWRRIALRWLGVRSVDVTTISEKHLRQFARL